MKMVFVRMVLAACCLCVVGGVAAVKDAEAAAGRRLIKHDAPDPGMNDVGALTRVFMYLAAGIAVDQGKMKDDAELASLLDRMFREGPDGAKAADELSAKIERDVRQSTALFISERICQRVGGSKWFAYWECEAQDGDKRLMKGSTGLKVASNNLKLVLSLIPDKGMSAGKRVVSEAWFAKHPLNGMKVGDDSFDIGPDGKVRFAYARRAKKPAAKTAPSIGERNKLVDFVPHGTISRNSEGDILKLKDGRLMVMWSRMMGSNSDDAKSHICRRYSSDGGKTWTDDEEVFETPAGSFNLMCVSLYRLQDGRIALVYLHKRSNADCRPVFRTSSDEGATWTEPVKMIPDAKVGYYVSNNGRLLQLKSGRIVLSTCMGPGPGLLVVYSDDGGASWKMSARVTAKTRIGGTLRMEEPGTFVKTDGTLVMFCRTNDDYQYWTESKDGGETWGPLVPSTLRSPRSPAVIDRLSDGRLCCVWNDHETHPEHRFIFPYHNGGRRPLTVGYSSDDGRTWTDRVDIETEGWLCYPAFKEIDGQLFILYCYGDGMKSMRLTTIPLSADAAWRKMKDEAVNRRRLVIWDDDGCDMTHYPYQRKDLVKEPASIRNFEQVFLEATERTKADVIGYSGTMGFGFFTQLRTGGYVNTNRFAEAHEPWRNAVNEFRALGVDSMDMATAFARRNGKEIFLSLRFNDNHDAASTLEKPNCLFSPFKMQNPEIMVGHGHPERKCCGRNAADFAQEKVRDFVRRYIRAYLENYDLDGIEFDFFRHPQLFRTVALGGHATEAELKLMTDLMKDFRAMAEEVGRTRGRPFVLGARMPDSVEYCRAIGIDLDAWLKAGALDFVVVGGYFQLKQWKTSADLVHKYGVRCYASLDEQRIAGQVKRQKGRMLAGRDDRRCWVARIAAAMAQGMDGVNLFNIEYFNHDDQRWIMRNDVRDLDGVDKRYFATYVGGGGYTPQHFLVGGETYFEITRLDPSAPVKLAAGASHALDFAFGDDFAAAAKKGLDADVEIEVLATNDDGKAPALAVNGRTLAPAYTVDGVTTFVAARDTFRKGLNRVVITAASASTLYDFSVSVTYRKAGTPSFRKSDFAKIPSGPVDKAVTSLGTWTAEKGHAELYVDDASRSRGMRLMGGERRSLQLELARPCELSSVKLWCERFTGRGPYGILVEARTADGAWHPVYAENDRHPTKERRALTFKAVPGPVHALRFSGTSAGGTIFYADER